MNTNPRGFAKGGDVKAGIPNYPNPNVTSGFLPMALGFAPGGEVKEEDSYWSKLYKAAVKVVAGYLGKDEDDEKVQETAKKFIGTEEGKKIAEQIIQSEQGASSGAPQDTGTPIPVMPSDRQPQFNLPQPVTPTDTVTTTPSDRQPQFNLPPSSVPLPKISTEQRQRDFEDKQKAPDTVPGITSIIPSDRQPGIGIANEMKPEIKPEKAGMFDLNEDGVVDMKDLDFAIENGLGWAIPALKKILGIVEDWNPDEPEKDTPEKIIPKGPDVDKETEIKESEEQEDKKEIKPELKIKPKPDEDGIAGIPPKGAVDVTGKPTLTKEEQNTLKKGADIAAGGVGDIKDKKDIPSWALPMMSAGFAMMASKNPNFLGALGEAGQAGVESYSAQKQAEEDKLDKEAEREYKKSMASYYEGREQKPDIKILTVDGRGVYHKWDSKTQNYVSLGKIAVPSDAEISTELETLYGADRWSLLTFDEKQKLITQKRNQYLGIASDNVTSGNEAAEGGGDWLKEWIDKIESWNPDKDD
jgi:hypothetical protein